MVGGHHPVAIGRIPDDAAVPVLHQHLLPRDQPHHLLKRGVAECYDDLRTSGEGFLFEVLAVDERVVIPRRPLIEPVARRVAAAAVVYTVGLTAPAEEVEQARGHTARVAY